MFKKIRVALNERVVAFRNGLPIRVLGPGKHTLWGGGLTAYRFDTSDLLVDAPAAVRRLLEEQNWIDEAELAPNQRGVLFRDGAPVHYLRPGIHRFWVVDPGVELRVMDINDPVPEMTDELADLIGRNELLEVTVNQHQRGLMYVQGKFEQLLEPGRYAFWTHRGRKVVVQLLDMREAQLLVPAQELMTRDKVTLRLTLMATSAPADPPTVLHSVADVNAALYALVQLAARDYVAGVTLDELLEGRDAMTDYLRGQVQPKAAEMGVDVRTVGVKDIVLPGEMKTLLNRVIEAEKEAAANVIARREEAAATRQMANTAKVMADNPVLLKLKEMEAVKDIAANVSEVKLNVGKGDLERLLGSGLLTRDGN
jgi:regulator of protease activity HflC (stomatin/prohibitin superfamily)